MKTLWEIMSWVSQKERFEKIEDYIESIFKTWKTTPKIHFSSPKNKLPQYFILIEEDVK